MTAAIMRRLAVPAVVGLLALPLPAMAQTVTPFTQAVAVAAASDENEAISQFFRETKYAPLWTGADAESLARREALLAVIDKAGLNALPAGRYDAERLRRLMANARSARDRGRLEVELSRVFLRFASDISTGILEPTEVVDLIKRSAPENSHIELMRRLASEKPHALMESLSPSSLEYTRLARERLKLMDAVTYGTWGEPVRSGRLDPGDSGPDVVRLRDRLVAMGYMPRSATQVFDKTMVKAVEAFQTDHGLKVDGIVGGKTREELNVSAEDRLGAVLVAMERERWMNVDRGERYIWVNLTDFHAKIIVDEEVYFTTKSVIGKNLNTHATPEFSDEMTHMVINPYWYVPRSIIVSEYLPRLRSNPYSVSHLDVIDSRGRTVSRGRGFSQYSASSFPFSMRQGPGPSNALGRVKFMFPNQYNIYLHDTPAQSLFSQTVRAFSHGCIRLDDPYEFAEALLTLEGDADPMGTFQRYLRSGNNTRLDFKKPIPVHLVYRTAIAKPGGGMEYRDDVYDRDAKILSALLAEGVEMPRADLQLASGYN